MANVSVGQVENLEEVISGLLSAFDFMESLCQTQINSADVKLSDSQNEANNSAQLLDSALEAEKMAQQRLEQSVRELQAANDQLSSANGALSACEASGYYDENGAYISPNCSSEASAVNVAETEVTMAQSNLELAQNELDCAKSHKMEMTKRNDMARQCMQLATQLAETVKKECSTRLSNANKSIELGKSRLKNAMIALNKYLNTNPSAANFSSWLKWSPPANKPVKPDKLNSRLNLSAEQQRYYFEYLSDRNPSFRVKIADYRNQLDAANGPAERLAVQNKIRKNFSGEFAEKIVERALCPLGRESNSQSRTTFDDGRYTKTDIEIKDLKAPVILGRGEGMSAPEGGSIAIEVKCGQARYLYSEKDHMVFQSQGHQKADASLTVCSRDINDLLAEKQDELREALRIAGSPLVGMLPKKEEIDKTCWDMITNTSSKNGETNEN